MNTTLIVVAGLLIVAGLTALYILSGPWRRQYAERQQQKRVRAAAGMLAMRIMEHQANRGAVDGENRARELSEMEAALEAAKARRGAWDAP